MAGKYKIVNNEMSGRIKGKKTHAIEGYEIKPKNALTTKNVLEVKDIIVVNNTLIKKLLLKKMQIKMKKIIEEFDDNDNPSPSDLKKILDEVERLRSILRNIYTKYLEASEVEKLFVKTNLLLQEVAVRAIEKEDAFIRKNIEKQEENNKSR